MKEYTRTLTDLEKKAVLFWPPEIVQQESAVSSLPLLLETQDKFISVLNLSDDSPESWEQFVDKSKDMTGNIFLKHLMVLSDLSGETLKNALPIFNHNDNKRILYIWNKKYYEYNFKEICTTNSITNNRLRVDGKSLQKRCNLSNLMKDVIMLILYGASSYNNNIPEEIKEKCTIGTLIGNSQELEKFVKQNYIRISRQTNGAKSNALGQYAQDFVIQKIKSILPNWQVNRNGTIPGVSHTDGKTETNFDIVVISPNKKYFGIEVSFQVTTNSVIERKAGQAQARAKIVHDAGAWICYVIDGAGNINGRKVAVSTICKYSDCTVALSSEEIELLTKFLKEKIGNGVKD